MADFSKFFNQTGKSVPPDPNFSPPFTVQTPNDWDEEGLYDLGDADDNDVISTDPPVVETPSPVLEPPTEEKLSRFFGKKEEASLAPLPNDTVRGDLLFAATAYVQSYKAGNPISFKQVCKLCGKKPAVVKEAFETEKWIKFFREFGLEPPKLFSKDTLTGEQLRCLQYVTNPLDNRKLNIILKEIGVTNADYRMWLRQPAFKELYTSWMRDGMKDVQGEVARQVTANATQGDPRAIETYLKLNGVNLQPTNNDVLIPFLLRKLQQLMSKEQLAEFTGELREITSGSLN